VNNFPFYVIFLLQENCQNYIRIMAKTAAGRLLLCGTNAFKPVCREYNILNGNYTMEKEKPGQAVCPYDPHHNSTAIYVGKYRYTPGDFLTSGVN
jgi:semaphorin 6